MIPKLAKPQQNESGSKQHKKIKLKNAKKSKRKEISSSSSCDSSCCASISCASSSSESNSSSSSSDTLDESYSRASTSTSSSLERERDTRMKRKGGRAGKKLDLDLLEMLWPKEDMPKQLQKKSVIEGTSMSSMLRMKDQYAKEIDKKGMGTTVYDSNQKPNPVKYKAMPTDYWDQVPTGRLELNVILHLQQLGVENVPRATIFKLHDRKVPVELGMMAREVVDMRQVQLAICSYVMVMRILHPIDMGGATIQWVLTEASYGKLLEDTEKARVHLVKTFFDSCTTENSDRAVRNDPPMDYEQVKSRWHKAAAIATMRQQMLANAMEASIGGKGGTNAQGATKNSGGGGGGGGSGGGSGGKPAAPTQKGQGNKI